METMESSKTVDQTSVRSELGRTQNLCGQALQGDSGFSSYSHTEVMFASEVSARENGGVANNVNENKESTNLEFENQILDAGNFSKGVVGGSVGEVAGLGNGNNCLDIGETEIVMDEAGIEKVVTQEGDMSQLNLVDSGNNVGEVSGNGISLYVEVFGPPDGIAQGADSSCFAEGGLFGSSICEENLLEGNDELLPDNGNKMCISEVQDCAIDENPELKAINNQKYRFNVGDFVWAKTKTQSWWPGLICEPSDVSEDSAKPERRDCLLVRYFWTENLFWRRPSQLKPFHEYFEQMSTQNNSTSFIRAVEKAVGEFGRHVKLEMTCPCFSEESRNNGVVKEVCKLGVFSVAQFDPVNFLARIKCFAQDISVPGEIEFTVIKNRLSAFYRSIGHQQLTIHQLKPTTDAKSNAQDGLTSPIISPKSTEKKVFSVENGDGGADGKSGKGYESRERRKSKYLSFPYVDLGLVHKSSTNLEENVINDHLEVSRDGQCIGSTPMVKSSGRKSKKRWSKKPIAGHEISNKSDAINTSSAEMLSKLRFTAVDCLYPDESLDFDLVERFFSRFRRMVFRDFTHEIANEDTVQQEFDNAVHLPQTLPEVEVQMEKKMQKGRKKKEKTIPMGLNIKLTENGPTIIDLPKSEPHTSGSQSVLKKRKRKSIKTLGLPQIKVMAGLPDLNGRSTGIQFEPSSVVKDTQHIGVLPTCDKPEPKKGKRRQKANQLPEMNCVPPEGKPQRKRRRRKALAGLMDVKPSYSEAQINGETLGTILLLKFAPEFPMPSKEYLVKTFCVFGPLKESETQVSNDSASAQVVFVSSDDARNAFKSLEKSNPFGQALLNYRLHILLAASGTSEPNGSSLSAHQAWPVVNSPAKPNKTSKRRKTPGKPSAMNESSADLQVVRQNLQMMTSMLENAEDNLSGEMRVKLESEIKFLLKKVSNMVGSSCS